MAKNDGWLPPKNPKRVYDVVEKGMSFFHAVIGKVDQRRKTGYHEYILVHLHKRVTTQIVEM